MELTQIQYFIEVAKLEHVTEAALALNVAQSAVSRQIFNLESELGVDLFLREGRNVRLTAVGKTFLSRMEQAMMVIENAKREVEEQLDPERGTIRVGFPSSLAAYILPTAIAEFRKRNPLVKFNLNQSSYNHLIDGVIKGKFDMAVLGSVPKSHSKITGCVFLKEQFAALLPLSHPLAAKDHLELHDLKDDSFVLFPEGYNLREVIDQACKQCGFLPQVSFEGEDIDVIKGLVSAGLGVTLLPETTLTASVPNSTVKIQVIEPQVSRTVGVIVPSARPLLPTEKLFFDFLKEFFEELERFRDDTILN